MLLLWKLLLLPIEAILASSSHIASRWAELLSRRLAGITLSLRSDATNLHIDTRYCGTIMYVPIPRVYNWLCKDMHQGVHQNSLHTPIEDHAKTLCSGTKECKVELITSLLEYLVQSIKPLLYLLIYCSSSHQKSGSFTTIIIICTMSDQHRDKKEVSYQYITIKTNRLASLD